MRRSYFVLPLALLIALLAGAAMATSPADGRNDSQYGYQMPDYGDGEMQYADDVDDEDVDDEDVDEYGDSADEEQAIEDADGTTNDASEPDDAFPYGDYGDAESEERYDSWSDRQESGWAGELTDEFAPSELSASSQEFAHSRCNRGPAPQELLEAADQSVDYRSCDAGFRGQAAADTDELYEYSDEEESYGDDGSGMSDQADDDYLDESQEQWDEEPLSQNEEAEEQNSAWQSDQSVEEQVPVWQDEEESAWQSDEEDEGGPTLDDGGEEQDSAWGGGAEEPGNVQQDYGQWRDEDESEDSEADETGVLDNPTCEWSVLHAVKAWGVRSLGGLEGVLRGIAQHVSVVQWLAANATGNSLWTAGHAGSSSEEFED